MKNKERMEWKLRKETNKNERKSGRKNKEKGE